MPSSDASSCFEGYERRFARAMASMRARDPSDASHRREIADIVSRSLGLRDEWIPTIEAETVAESLHDGFLLKCLQARSWPGVLAAAHLYLPQPSRCDGMPFVLLCCGHDPGGKLCDGYQLMARSLARRGAAVLVPDNIGQGEREAMGHRHPVAPFFCGTSVIGLILMETMAWLDWARSDQHFDPARMAAIGNSGGGHITSFLAALDEDLAALSSSGNPCTFEYTARKERDLCNCAIVPHIVGEIEMWQLFGCFAPRPILLFQGMNDHMFPWDLFHSCARKVKAVYAARGCVGAFRACSTPGGHSWDASRRELLCGFLSETLRLPYEAPIAQEDEQVLAVPEGACYESWPGEALTTDELASWLTGIDAPKGLSLADVYVPAIDGAVCSRLIRDGQPHDVTRIFAQFEAFLKEEA